MKKFMGTPYPWRWFTSNSHARLSSEVTGKDGDVIHAYKAHDGMACVNVKQCDMAVIATAPELLHHLQLMVEDYESRARDIYDGTGSLEDLLSFTDDARKAIGIALGVKV